MPEVVILALSDSAGCGDACGCGDAEKPRVPVLMCADALRAGGAAVKMVIAGGEPDIDSIVTLIETDAVRLVVAAATDAEVRAVVRRLVRRYAPPPSRRPAELPANRTVFDLPPLAVLPLAPAMPDLVRLLGVPADPASVAAAVLAGRECRFDLLRTDAGSVTLGGTLIGGPLTGGPLTGAGAAGASAWRGRVEVDDVVLTDGSEPVLACSVRNVGPSELDGLPLVVRSGAATGQVEVAVAIPVLRRRLMREASARVEVRRTRGRAASVTPRDDGIPYVDDGVAGTLTRKRSWWVEPGAWAAYVM